MKTPVRIDNRPGLSALRYRVGTYADFRASMLARLGDTDPRFAALNSLSTLDADDPTIALLDAFATIGEILTFYQERLANEGYIRTATMRASLQELAKLTGYQLRPGVASSVFLAFTLDPSAALTLAVGTRAQSVPGPGQTPQSFEISDDLAASGIWNAMPMRTLRPTQPDSTSGKLYIDGTATGLKPNDPILVVANNLPKLQRVDTVEPQADRKRTVVTLQLPPEPPPASLFTEAAAVAVATLPPTPGELVMARVKDLATLASRAPAQRPANSQALVRSSEALFAPQTEAALRLTAGETKAQQAAVFRALGNTPLGDKQPALQVFAFRASTAPFGNRAPPRVVLGPDGQIQPPQEWTFFPPGPASKIPFTIDIGFQSGRAGARVNLLRTMASAANGGEVPAFDLISTFTFGDARLMVTITDAAEGKSATHQLSDRFGNVTVSIVRLQFAPDVAIELDYAFDAQKLTIVVQYLGSGPWRVANAGVSDNPVTLAISQEPQVSGTIQQTSPGTTPSEQPNELYLDGTFETVKPGSWVVLDAPADPTATKPPPMRVDSVATVSRTAYGQTNRSTRLTLPGAWINTASDTFTHAIRQTSVYTDSVQLTLQGETVDTPLKQTPDDTTVELDGLYPGLTSGRWLIVTGERDDLPGVTAAEVVMLARAEHVGEDAPDGAPAGETAHTVLTFADPLSYPYKRSSVRVLGNVAAATQGESVEEILGSGDGSQANQIFKLKKPPVTFLPSTSAIGFISTLRIWVNNIEWHEVSVLLGQARDAKVFTTQTGADGSVTVQFGDGVQGARLPTGAENIRARYRSGIGLGGNVDAGTITNLLSRPLGLTGVTNPIAASGGADADSPDQIRANAPLGLVSLQHLVSVEDYQDFALARPGIGKAAAVRFDGADGSLIHLTLAGAQDDPLDTGGKLWTTLATALQTIGEPSQDVEIARRMARVALIEAGVTVAAGYLWTDVQLAVRTALTATFAFSKRDLGKTLYVSEVIAAIQGVRGVSHVNLTRMTDVPQPSTVEQLHAAINAGGVHDLIAQPARVDPGSRGRPRKILPAELVYLPDTLPDLLVLNEVKQ